MLNVLRIRTLGAIEDGEYFNLEEAFLYNVYNEDAHSSLSREESPVEVVCLCSGNNKVYSGRADGVITSFDRGAGLYLRLNSPLIL